MPAGLSVGPVENVSRLPGNQAEASIAINPLNPNNIVAVSNSVNENGVRVYRTFDAGTTWSTQLIGPGPLGTNPCCDSEVVFDSFGNLFFVYLDFAAGGRSANVLTSTDGGQTFALAGRVITDAGLDQPTIAVGPGAVAGTASVWVSTHTSSGIQAAGATITGLGAISAFSSPEVVPSSVGGNFGNTAVGPNGQVIVTFQNPSNDIGPSVVLTALDVDGTGPQTFIAATMATTTNVGGFRPIPAQPSRTVDAEANCVFDNSFGAHRGRLYLVYTDAANTATNDLDIILRFSDDNGTTWSNPVRVNDDATANSQFFPGIAVDPTSGAVAVGFFDCRNSPNNDMPEYFVTVSADGGLSFLPNVQVSSGPSHGTADVTGDPNEFGDFYTLDFFNNIIRPVWADNSTTLPGNPDFPTLDIASAAIFFDAGPPPPPPVVLTGTMTVGEDAGGVPVVRVIDLSTGGIAREFFAYDPKFRGGVRVAVADVNGDGVPDIITAPGEGGGPHIKVFSGVTFQPLLSPVGSFMAYDINFRGGVYIAAADVNGDGFADIITGAGFGGGPHVRIFSGLDGSVIAEFMAYDMNFRGGVTVAAGDVNGDHFADVVTGAGKGGGPHVKAFDIHNGQMLLNFFAYSSNFRGGVFVSTGDVDGDGREDIITGAGAGGGSHVRVFSSFNAASLASFFAFSNVLGSAQYVGDSNYNGGVRITVQDADGDGRADILAVPGAGGKPTARFYSALGNPLGFANVFDPSFLGGIFVG